MLGYTFTCSEQYFLFSYTLHLNKTFQYNLQFSVPTLNQTDLLLPVSLCQYYLMLYLGGFTTEDGRILRNGYERFHFYLLGAELFNKFFWSVSLKILSFTLQTYDYSLIHFLIIHLRITKGEMKYKWSSPQPLGVSPQGVFNYTKTYFV